VGDEGVLDLALVRLGSEPQEVGLVPRLFRTLSSFERSYRPALAARFGEEVTR
jgi:hypothetical protein